MGGIEYLIGIGGEDDNKAGFPLVGMQCGGLCQQDGVAAYVKGSPWYVYTTKALAQPMRRTLLPELHGFKIQHPESSGETFASLSSAAPWFSYIVR
jgi:hypothetical protein